MTTHDTSLRTRTSQLRNRPRYREPANFTATSHPQASPILAPFPTPDHVEGAISDLFDILAGTFRDTSLEPDLDDLLWYLTDLFHKKSARVQRQLEDNEDRQEAPARTGRLRSALGRTRDPHRPGPEPHRAPRSLRAASAISPPSAMRPRPARPGVPAPEASSTTST